jgi:predicted nuclease with TOPRIM domain
MMMKQKTYLIRNLRMAWAMRRRDIPAWCVDTEKRCRALSAMYDKLSAMYDELSALYERLDNVYKRLEEVLRKKNALIGEMAEEINELSAENKTLDERLEITYKWLNDGLGIQYARRAAGTPE